MKRSSLTGLIVAFYLTPFAHATITWNFDNGTNGDLGVTSKAFTQGTTTLTAYGVNDTTGAALHLWNKNVVPTDMGLGTAPGVSNEIDTINIVELDVSHIAANTTMSVLISSLANDSFNWYTKTTAGTGTLGAFTLGGSFNGSNNPFNLIRTNTTNEFIAITATVSGQSVLLNALSIPSALTPTPEPGFFGVVLLAVLGIGIVARKRRAAEQV